MKLRVAIAVDRSMLAANMYRLLMEPMSVGVINSLSLEEMYRALRIARDPDLVVISSNVFSDNIERVTDVIGGDERLTKVAKIFLLRDGEIEKGWDQHVRAIPHSLVMGKPFHPDEFALRVRRVLAIEE